MKSSIEELVHDELDRLTAGVSAPAGLAAQAVRQHHRRRAITRAGTAAVAAAAAIAVAVIMVPGGTGGAGTRVMTTAYLTRRVDSALSAASTGTLIEQVSLRWNRMWQNGRPLRLGDEITWSYRDVPRKDEFFAPDGRPAGVYWPQNRVYARPAGKTRSTARTPGPGHPAPTPVAIPVRHFNPAPSAIRGMLGQHELTFTGYGQVAGQRAVKLAAATAAAGALTLYVSPGTFRPLAAAVPWATEYFRGMPTTRASLGALSPRIPAGWQKARPAAYATGQDTAGLLPLNPLSPGLTTAPPRGDRG